MDLSSISGGVVCLTFDDGRYAEWLEVLPLFREHHVRVTFFFDKPITAEALDAMRRLVSEGHSVGLHTLNHKDAIPNLYEMGAEEYIHEQIMPQLLPVRQAGIPLSSFAYPNNRRDAGTDQALRGLFRRFRAGAPDGRDQAFQPLDGIADETVMHGLGIGDYYHTTHEQLAEDLERCHRQNCVLTYFSHGIFPHAPHVHMPLETLEFLLDAISRLGIRALGFDDLARG